MELDFYPPGLPPPPPGPPVEVAPGVTLPRREQSADSIRQLALGLRARYAALRAIPAHAVLNGLARVHAAWAAEESELRRVAAQRVALATGYPERAVDTSLRNSFGQMDGTAMARWLKGGGVTPEMLDPAPPSAQWVAAFGPRLTTVISSGNVPGAALPSVVQSLLLKSPTLVKTASAEPFLLPLYSASVAEELPEVAAGLLVTHWPGGSTAIEGALLAEVEALVAYGGDAVLQGMRQLLPPRARLLAYGHRLSFSAVGRELLTDMETAREAARRAALDLALFDQQGCYSPQVAYIERGGNLSPEAFGTLLAEELAALEAALPRRRLTAGAAAAIHQFRGRVEMRALGEEVRIWSSPGGTQWTVTLTPCEPLHPGPLNRTAVLHPVADLSELPGLIFGQEQCLLAAALGAPEPRRSEIAQALALAGVCRICDLGRAQLPGDAMHHDGVNAIATLARFVALGG